MSGLRACTHHANSLIAHQKAPNQAFGGVLPESVCRSLDYHVVVTVPQLAVTQFAEQVAITAPTGHCLRPILHCCLTTASVPLFHTGHCWPTTASGPLFHTRRCWPTTAAVPLFPTRRCWPTTAAGPLFHTRRCWPTTAAGPLFHARLHANAPPACSAAAALQLNAMRENNVPRMNHGVQTLYEYAVDAGSMERSRYFGFSSDMYHFDHFMGKALWNFSDFIDRWGDWAAAPLAALPTLAFSRSACQRAPRPLLHHHQRKDVTIHSHVKSCDGRTQTDLVTDV
eukprot:365072-Chlamydomonas_euryale.AAC.20